MSQAAVVDVSRILEKQRLSPFLLGLVAISWIVTFFDGLDSNLISFAAPYFRSDYHLSTAQTGYIFSMHQYGTLAGGFLLAFLGDRIGRRPTVILATAGFGVFTMLFYFADSYRSLMALRLLDGLPLGGMLPLAWALNIEYAPKLYRATIVTVIMGGYSVGTAVGGPVANWLIPHYGWKSVFIFGGAAAILSSLVLLKMLPESIRFLASKGKRPDQIAAILRRVAPGEVVPAGAQFIVGDEPGHAKNFNPALLFKGRLARITPLLWIAYIASSFAVFFIVNWTPTVFESLGYTREQAANASALNSIMGLIGGILLMRFTDRKGAIAITVMPVACTICLLVAGFTTMPLSPYLVLMATIGFFLIGGHFGMHSISGIFYPSAYRGNGAGWATSVAKIGSIAGPTVGGLVLPYFGVGDSAAATGFATRNLFAALAICPIIFAITIYAVGKMHSGMLGRETEEEPAAPRHTAVAGEAQTT